MRFTCERSILLKEIAIAQEIISSKNVISIYSNIFLEADNDTLFIKATDTKVNFQTKVPVTVEESGSITVFGEKFLGILNSCPEGEVIFDQKETIITIKSSVKKANWQLKSIAAEKFPEFAVSTVESFDLPIRDFKDMIEQTIFAVSDDETRYFMNGVFFEKAEDKIIMVATDGRRLAYIAKTADSAIKDFSGIIVPPKILNILAKRAGDEGPVSISVTDKTIFIKFGSYSLSSVLLEGQFPNYRRVIPENLGNSCSINRLDTLDALRRVSLLVEQKSRRVYLGLAPGSMAVYSEDSELGTAREEIPCKYDGPEVSIALNYHYLEEPFKAMDEEDIVIKFGDTTKAIIVQPVPERDLFHIIMPMQLD
ncbi:MAG: DNA polymerase III subunit beta [Treponema sp.]|jgi:DNA polymerase-3 subunit beta|nr:DNA polymerase III subunit beta [Treponema sp.]